MKPTQLQFVIDQLRKDGSISRNYCLSNRITRLGAIVNSLNKEGWDIQGDFVKTDYGKDYVYKKLKEPELTLFR